MDKPIGRSLPIDADLHTIRQAVHAFAAEAGLAGDRLQNLVLAVNEAVTNVLEHGAGTGAIHLWREARGVRVQIVDPAGRLRPADLDRPPPWPPTRGMGLWVIRQVCDEVRLDHPEGHSRLELFMAYRSVAEPPGERSSADVPPREWPGPRRVIRLRCHRATPLSPDGRGEGEPPEDGSGRPRPSDAAAERP
ncbi:ATP-binding protein [Actinomadura sp. ATCC 31491]|uniref:ATP-binding protein n=1 Tax=Actinomadura luzonensis TaxID=2805427 RepID=A0ABT0FR69_9ACTN|nr:ATP-binding protein [Actinomadura luzonensis]MCK2214807.1 ATP-binding protein [Actinomadura luzonensis]